MRRIHDGMRYTAKNSLLIFVALVGASCSRITVPPVSSTPTGSHDTGRFVWLDLVTEDVDAVKRFYGGLFGWTFDRISDHDTYTLILKDDEPMGGIVFSDRLNDVSESRWVGYLSVPDVDSAVDVVRAQGGEIYVEPRNVPDRGRLAVVADPQDAILTLLTATGGDPPPDRVPEPGEWMWIELWTTDTDRAFAFYEELVGYKRSEFGEVGGAPYQLMRRDGRFRGGMVRLPWSGVEPNWLPYVLVDDPSATAQRVKALGGRVILSPDGVLHSGAAVIVDPSGAVFGVQRRPDREARSQ